MKISTIYVILPHKINNKINIMGIVYEKLIETYSKTSPNYSYDKQSNRNIIVFIHFVAYSFFVVFSRQ